MHMITNGQNLKLGRSEVDKSVDLLPSVPASGKALANLPQDLRVHPACQPNFRIPLWRVAGASLAGLGMLGTCNGMGDAPRAP